MNEFTQKQLCIIRKYKHVVKHKDNARYIRTYFPNLDDFEVAKDLARRYDLQNPGADVSRRGQDISKRETVFNPVIDKPKTMHEVHLMFTQAEIDMIQMFRRSVQYSEHGNYIKLMFGVDEKFKRAEELANRYDTYVADILALQKTVIMPSKEEQKKRGYFE